MSYGLWQPAVKFLGTDVPGLTRGPDGAALDPPENRQIGRDFCFDAERLATYVASRYAALLARWADPLEAWCRWNAPGVAGVDNPNRSNYVAGLQAAVAYVPKQTTVVDLRGQLPTNSEAQYVTRPLDAITGITLHYTEAPTNRTAADIAAYQTSEAARGQTGNNTPFPGIAWNQWLGVVQAELGRSPAVDQADPTNGFSIGPGFRDFLLANPEWGKARMSELPIDGGSYVWTTPTAEHPKGSLLVYRQWLNSVRPVAWD